MPGADQGTLQQRLTYPSLCRGKMLFRLFTLTQVVAILLAFSPGYQGDPWIRLGIISLCSHWTSLLSLGVLCPLLQRLQPLTHFQLAGLIFAILVLMTFMVSGVIWWYFAHELTSYSKFWTFASSNMLLAGVLALMLIQLLIMHAERTALLVTQQQAKLDALQARIEPHFLFNSLNAISELTHQSSLAAEQSLLDLADLFRAAMQVGQLTPLSQELALAQKYLQLEALRLGNKLQIAWHLPVNYPDTLVPALTLQPLLENAVRYGVEPSIAPVEVTIELLVGKEQIVVLVSNPINVENIATAKQNGLAIDNIRARLALIYADNQQLSFSTKENIFRVKLVLPITSVEKSDAGVDR